MAQDRKVFVGGVPQDLNQDDLYAIFSEYEGVKKAWLQKCRTPEDGSGSNSCPPQNHRGFGFVIFHDSHAIDELIGNGPSRFIVLRSGAKLEVKRALSSNKMGQQDNASGSGQAPQETAMVRGGRGQQQAFRGQTAHDLPSSHVAGSSSQPRGPAQQGQLRDLRHRSAAAQQAQQAAAQQAVQAAAALQAVGYHSGAAAQAQLLAGAVPRAPGAAENALMLEALQGAYSAALPRHVQVPAMVAAAAAAAMQPPGFASAMSLAALGGAGPAAAHGAAVDYLLGQRSGLHCQAPASGLREAVMRFYNEHCPEKLSERELIDVICEAYEGREDDLDQALRSKYGTGLQQRQLPHADRARRAAAAAAAAATMGAGCDMRPAPGLGNYGDPAYLPQHEAWGTMHKQHWRDGDAAAGLAGLGQGPTTPRKVRGRTWPAGIDGDHYAHYNLHPSGERREVTSPDLSWVNSIVDDEEKNLQSEVARQVLAGKVGRQEWLASSFAVR